VFFRAIFWFSIGYDVSRFIVSEGVNTHAPYGDGKSVWVPRKSAPHFRSFLGRHALFWAGFYRGGLSDFSYGL
jgi:hypothetical protein